MKKNEYVLALDPEDEFDGFAYLFFLSAAPTYSFADDLNHLYPISLAREENIIVDGVEWPLYSYYDPVLLLHYYLVERPAQATGFRSWGIGHKLLIIKGSLAADKMDEIESDFTEIPVPPADTDLLGIERYRLMKALHDDFIPVNRFNPDHIPDDKKSAAATRQLSKAINMILDELDHQSVHRHNPYSLQENDS